MKRAYRIEITVQQFRVTTTVKVDRRILNDACAVLEKAGAPPVARPWYERGPGRFMKLAAGLALAAAVLLVAIVLCNRTGTEPQPTPDGSKPAARPGDTSDVPGVEDQLAAERAEIDACYTRSDVDGLIRLLDQALRENRILVAIYLGQIGDERALDALSRQAEQWQGEPAEDPFTAAVEQINRRVQSQEPNEPNVAPGTSTVMLMGSRVASVLSGTITDVETGEPIEGVTVRIRPADGGRMYVAVTDADGLYAFPGIEADGRYDIWLTAPEHITSDRWTQLRQMVDLARTGQLVKDFALEKGARLELAAVDETRQPVSSVCFHAAYAADEMGRGPKEPVTSAGNGTALLGGLRPDEYVVVAAHPGYAPAVQTVRIRQPQQVRSVVFELERGMDVVGLATCSDGLPPSGWMISAKPTWWHNAYSWPFPVPIADDGTFTLEHIVAGSYRLAVHVPVKGSPQELWSVDVNLPPEGGLLDLQIPESSSYAPNTLVSLADVSSQEVTPRTVQIAGQVVDGRTGRPVTDFQLHVAGQAHWCRVSDPCGWFEIEGDVRVPLTVHVTAEGYGAAVVDEIDPKVSEPVIVALDGTASIEGVVINKAGYPIEGVSVSHRFGRDIIATTDRQGHFAIEDVSVSGLMCWLVFRHPDYARAVKQLTVSGALADDVTIVMSRGTAVEGRLYDGQGKPRPFVPLHFLDEQQYRRGSYDTALATVVTDAEGFYRVDDLPAGLCCVVPDYLDDTLGVGQIGIVPQEDQTLWLDIGGPGKTSGRLLYDGVPRADTLLMVRYQLDDNTGFEACARTDAQGRFCFYGMPVGRRHLYWGGNEPTRDSEGWCHLCTFDFQAGVDQDLGDLDTTDGADLLVELTGAARRDLLDSYDLFVNREMSTGTTRFGQLVRQDDRALLFGLSGLVPGRYEVVAERPGYPSVRQPFTVQSEQDSGTIRLAIPTGSGTVSGVLQPFVSEEVHLGLLLRSMDNGRITAHLRPAADGSFKVEHLPPGNYMVTSTGSTRSIVRAAVGAGQHRVVTVPTNVGNSRCAEEGHLVILLVTEDGLPLPGAEVRISYRAGVSPMMLMDDRGARKSFMVPPGRYQLRANHSGFRSLQLDVEVPSMQGRTVQEILEPLVITMHSR